MSEDCLGITDTSETRVSMGALETKDVHWTNNLLAGRVKGSGGGATTLFFYLPDGYKLGSVLLDGASAVHKISGHVLEVSVGSNSAMADFELRFAGEGGCVLSRERIPGAAARRY